MKNSKTLIVLLAAGILAIAVSACTNNSTGEEKDSVKAANAPSKTTGYLASAADNSWIIYLDTAGGLVDIASYSDGSKLGEGGKPQVNIEHGTFGRSGGEAVDFIGIDLAVLKSCPCRMLYEGSNLQILVSTSSGLETLTFHPSNVADYNSSVSKLNAKVAQINTEQEKKKADEHAAKQAHEQQVLAKEQATCAQVGGKWYSDGICSVHYTYDYNPYYVKFDDDGNVAPRSGESPESCASNHNVWHSDTAICEIVAP
ncbi:MAG: hypothetical protein HZB44_01615 [Actinobacteria bacterium]|nr:hypothetical protein [Actinomycetota bacterium]